MEDSITHILKEMKDELRSHPYSIMGLRHLRKGLIDYLSRNPPGKEFFFAMSYHKIIEDILQTSVEDDYVKDSVLKDAILLLCDSIDSLLNHEHDVEQWTHKMSDFCNKYRAVAGEARLSPLKFVHDGVSYYARRAGGPYASASSIGDRPLFPILENSLTNPEHCERISDQFLSKAKEIVDEGIDRFCFLEKSYATVGAILMLPSIVKATGTKALIYREGMWVKDARFVGEPALKQGEKVCMVYDAVISGMAVLGLRDHLKTYGANLTHALVYYVFDVDRVRDELKHEGIKLLHLKSYDGDELYKCIEGLMYEELRKKPYVQPTTETLNQEIIEMRDKYHSLVELVK